MARKKSFECVYLTSHDNGVRYVGEDGGGGASDFTAVVPVVFPPQIFKHRRFIKSVIRYCSQYFITI